METVTGQSSAESAAKELHAYAKLLFLRSGRQFEDKTLYRELEGDGSLHESVDGGSSSKNIPLGNLDVDRLRREFLDRLSETVSSTKGGRHVVASHMFYWPDKVKVFVAINSGFAEGDALSKFLGNLCTALKDIAVAPDNQTEEHTDALWNALLRHQSPRLNAVILDLRRIMKSLLPQHSSPESTSDGVLPEIEGAVLDLDDCLKLLTKLLFGKHGSDLEKHNSLVSLGHALYRTFPAERFQTLGRGGDKLHQAIGFLGRLQMSFRVLVAAARQISGFDDLSLIPVVGLKTQKKPLSQEWSLAKTFHALNLQPSETTIDKLMGPSSKVRWTKNKLLNDFSRLKSPTWEVHAEIQLIIFILSHPEEVANGKRFDYLGCSKYSCLLCSKFLRFFQALKTRGCHGKLYDRSWTVPLGDGLGESEQHMLSAAVMKVISWMRKELNAGMMLPAQRRSEAKESTVGGSLVATPEASQEDYRQSHAASEYLRRQRAQNSLLQSKKESFSDPIEREAALRIQLRHETLAENAPKSCAAYCGVETIRRCSHCRGALFCGKTCERQMPLSHLLKCSMRQVTSADYLYEDVREDKLPTDPQVRQDYWFDRCETKDEESHLLGLFAGLLHFHPHHIRREALHEWRSHLDGNSYLAVKIIEKFEELPNNSRGEYFSWFLGHRARFECQASIPRALCPMTQVQNMQARARQYLGPEDRQTALKDLTPFAKRYCFGFYSMVADNLHPSPIDWEHCHWFDFGFVVSHDQHEEGTLGSMYNTILFGSASHENYARSLGSSGMEGWVKKKDPVCSFDEFWRAWEKGELMTMFSKCWPDVQTDNLFTRAEYGLLTRLRAFFETPHSSIWRLRHFLAMEDVSVESATSETARAARDYGFSEQLDTRTTMELREFYVQLLKKEEPLAIHRERMAGKLVQFVESHGDGITPRVKNVLRGLL